MLVMEQLLIIAKNLPVMYQVYEQKKRLSQTSIEELKGIKNKN